MLNSLNVATNNKIKGLTIEAIKTGEATGAIKLYIQQLYQQAEAMAYVDQLKDLYRKKSDNEEVIRRGEKGDTTIGEAFGALFDSDTYKDGGIKKVLSGDHWGKAIAHRAEQENKAYDIAIESTKKKIEARADIIAQAESSAGNDQVVAINNTSEKVNKATEKHEKELAEVFSKASIADLEKRISEWNNALQRADTENDVVKVRKTDKYGKEKETGETVSIAYAVKQVEDLERAKAEALKKIQKLSFDEQLAETERQWNVRYQIAKQYGEEVAKAQFPNLKGDSYFDELNKQFKPLDDRYKSGAILSDADLKKWETLKKIIDSLNGVKDPFTNFTDGLDEGMSKLSTYAEKMEFLNKQMYSPEIMSGEGVDNKHKAEIIKRQEDLKKSWQQTYQSILEEQKTYEEKSAELAKQYAEAKKSDQYKNGTDSDRKKVDTHFNNAQGVLDMDFIQKSKEWEYAFSELEGMSKTSLDRILSKLLEFQQKSKGTLSLQDAAKLQEAIDKVKNASNQNPFSSLIFSIRQYRENLKLAKQAQDEYNIAVSQYGKNSEEASKAAGKMLDANKKSADSQKNLISQIQKGQDIFNAIGEGVMQLGDAFGGFDDATNDAIGNIMAIGNAAMDLGKSIASGNVAGMIKAGVQLISSIGKALNGDQKKERQIKKQAAQLKILETAYNDLAYAAEKAFGSQKYSAQTDVIKNLEQQKAVLNQMIATESSKKKADKGKIAEWERQIQTINQSIEQMKTKIVEDVLQTSVVDAASKVGDALVDAFGRGESAVDSLNNAANDMIKNLLTNQLNLMLQNRMKPILDDLLAATGMNADGTGSFNGLTPEEIASFKAQVQAAGADMQEFLEVYSDIFGGLDANASSLEGAIKGVSEETASLIAGQMNAIRIVQAQMLENSNISIAVLRNSLLQLTQIEINTRFLRLIYLEVSKNNNDGSIRASGLI